MGEEDALALIGGESMRGGTAKCGKTCHIWLLLKAQEKIMLNIALVIFEEGEHTHLTGPQ